jgi:hypothetical protein
LKINGFCRKTSLEERGQGQFIIIYNEEPALGGRS